MAINYWLIKSEPDVFSWDDFAVKKSEPWTGVRNYAARIHLRAMQKGDLCFYYHSGGVSAVVGIAKVVKTAYPDPTATEGEWVSVDVAPVKKFKKDVPLKEIKKDETLQDMPLVRISRLSVSPVSEHAFFSILAMGETKL